VNAPIERIDVRAYRIPTQNGPESDGTAEWDATTLVLVQLEAAQTTGTGYTYADRATAELVRDELAAIVLKSDPQHNAMTVRRMWTKVRNLGQCGIAAMAISAVDVALWDLKSRLSNVPLCELFGMARNSVPVYGSGGFTSYTIAHLCEQLSSWVRAGIPRVKMKVARKKACDAERVASVRKAIGRDAELYVDANGGYSVEEALALAEPFAASRVTWFEEPVPHHDMDGLRRVRERVPRGMAVASGEYGYRPEYFARMIRAGAVDVVQVDATRCGGFSGLLAADALCAAANLPLSTHCAPHLHVHGAMACKMLRHAEYFHDHVRVERMLFDGIADPVEGALAPDLTRPGHGLEFKAEDAERYRVY
jgi:L-alanine-DL-glutamate epimerase-like enolase superfamily enzyme